MPSPLRPGLVCQPISTCPTPSTSWIVGPTVPRNAPVARSSTIHSPKPSSRYRSNVRSIHACVPSRSNGAGYQRMCSGSENIACRSSRSSCRYGRSTRRSVSSAEVRVHRRRTIAGATSEARSTILGEVPRTRSVDGHQGQAAPPPVLGRAGRRTREVPVRRCRGRGSLGLLHRRVPAHDRQGDPRHLAPAVRRGPSRRRGVHRPRHAPPRLGGGHDRRHRRREAGGRAAGGRPSAGAPRGRRTVARDGAGADVRVRVRVLPARTRRGRRVAARRPALAPRLRHGRLGRPERHGRRDGRSGAALRVPDRGVGERVRHGRLRGQHPLQGSDRGRRRVLPVPSVGQGDRDQAGQARDVPGPAVQRSRRQRAAPEHLVPAGGRFERPARPERDRRPRAHDQGVHRGDARASRGHRGDRAPRTRTPTSVSSPTC